MEARNLQTQGGCPSSGIQFGPEPTEKFTNHHLAVNWGLNWGQVSHFNIYLAAPNEMARLWSCHER
jgi:hypothetical protein